MINLKIDGAKELNEKLKTLGSPPQKMVTKAARAGMVIALRATRRGRWIDQTGEMRKGMKLIGEKSKFKAKKVYQVVFDRAKNNIFQKPIKNPGSRGGKGNKTGYYPASQEYGYFAGEGNYVPGFHFMSRALEDNSSLIKDRTTKSMHDSIDKIIRK